MAKTFLPGSPEIQAAAKAAGINVPYYGAEVEGDHFRFYLYGGRTVTVKALPLGTAQPARAAPQRPKPAVTFSGDLASMSKAELIDLARTSYRLRDDDNIYLGRIEAQMNAAIDEGKRRLRERTPVAVDRLPQDEMVRALRNPRYIPEHRVPTKTEETAGIVKARQL